MPDHLHLLVCANPDGVALGAWVKALKAFVATSEFRWQKSFFDHVIRHDESETEKWEYVRQNPVRAGLVAKVEDWPYAGEIPEYPAPRQVTRPTITQKRAVPLVKVCGITNLDDARLAAELGADMLGFFFYAKSPRAVSREAAAQICRTVTVEKVGVFVNETEANIRQTFQECGLTALQFHGDESPAFCNLFSARKIKAIRVRDAESLRTASEYDVDALLLDTYTDTQRGGTGKTFDWSLAVQAKTLGKPIILSGGLAPDNVRDAIRTVQPYAVDVASGVEREPGRKDTEKLRRFFEACRNP